MGRTDSYDVDELGFNYRIDDIRSALALARLPRLESDIAKRRTLTRRYRTELAGIPGIELPYTDEDVAHSTCYVMPILVPPEQRDAIRERLLERHGVQTSLFYPPTHLFSAYRDANVSLPRTELAAQREITIPLYPHMTESDQTRVIVGLTEELAER
jgi:dTDP-4-amino-4,6-dideoxygalactose transaminase